MKYFLDTEFIEGFHKPLFGKRRHHIDLISLGMVSEDGVEKHFVSHDFNPHDANEWVQRNVLTTLYEDLVKQDWNWHKYSDPAWDPFPHRYTPKRLKRLLKVSYQTMGNQTMTEYIKKFVDGGPTLDLRSGLWPDEKELAKHNPDKNGHAQPEFYGYYCDYDWVLFCSLFGTMMDLPKGFPMYCRDTKQMLDELAESMTEAQLFENIDFKTQESFTDAQTIRSKPELLKMHRDYPKQSNEHNALADARWIRDLYNFIQNVKSGLKTE